MLISLNWLRDFVDIPATCDPHELAGRFTMICAEVEEVRPIEVHARGLIAAGVLSHKDLAGTRNLKQVVLDVGGGKTVETVTAAHTLRDGESVVYAPPGAGTQDTGQLGETVVAGQKSAGMILSGESLGMPLVAEEAIFCPPDVLPGAEIDGRIFDDWIIEVDNKSITHRPDLWGHYGIAREVAAIIGAELKPYPVTSIDELRDNSRPEIPIRIDDPIRCPRYSGLMMTGVGVQASPLWMQARLGHVGMRPIDCLVDLTNYIMAELGQPMHAFDADHVDRIEVGVGKPGSKFTTLDGVERVLPADSLLILSGDRPVALAGVMGGLETEVSTRTNKLLLESANFEPAGIRRTAVALGLRTEASARFEKSLDPAHTVLAIQRFCKLAKPEFAELKLASRLSDCYPKPAEPVTVRVDPAYVNRYMGREVPVETIASILKRIAFDVSLADGKLRVAVPSFRATKDVSIEADVIEEIARYIGFENIEPVLPSAEVRCFEPNAEHRVERDSLRSLCLGMGFHEVHLYIWYDREFCSRLGLAEFGSVELRNPVAAGQEYLREALLPGLLQAADRNRLHFDAFNLCEVGSVFHGGGETAGEERHLALICAQRGKGVEDALLSHLKGVLDVWSWQVLGHPTALESVTRNERPVWAHESKTARVVIGGERVGMVSVLPLAVRRSMDEHLAAWGLAWAEIRLGPLCGLKPPDVQLAAVPEFPEVELDFSMLVSAERKYGEVCDALAKFEHPLVRRLSFIDWYEGKSVPAGKRSLTYRVRIGAVDRTLGEQDLAEFRSTFERHVAACGYEIRKG